MNPIFINPNSKVLRLLPPFMLPAARDETDGLRTKGALISWAEVPCLAAGFPIHLFI